MKRRLFIIVLFIIVLGGCAMNSMPDESPIGASFDLDVGREHYRGIATELMAAIESTIGPIDWTEDRAEDVNALRESDGSQTARYRSALFVADRSCSNEPGQFEKVVSAAEKVLRNHDFVERSDLSRGGNAGPNEVKWHDKFDGTVTLGSDKRCILWLASGPLAAG